MENLTKVRRSREDRPCVSIESLINPEADTEALSLALLEKLRTGEITVNDLMVGRLFRVCEYNEISRDRSLESQA